MNPINGLSLGRIALGTAALLAPRLAARGFRLDADANPQLSYMLRMFGSREIAIGTITLLAPSGGRRGLVLGGIAIDAADAVAGGLAGRDRSVSASTAAMLALPALAAVAAGVIGSRE